MGGGSQWMERDPVAVRGEYQSVAGVKMQIVAQSLWDQNAAGVVERNGSVHIRIENGNFPQANPSLSIVQERYEYWSLDH
jgi:hypothetical protein